MQLWAPDFFYSALWNLRFVGLRYAQPKLMSRDILGGMPLRCCRASDLRHTKLILTSNASSLPWQVNDFKAGWMNRNLNNTEAMHQSSPIHYRRIMPLLSILAFHFRTLLLIMAMQCTLKAEKKTESGDRLTEMMNAIGDPLMHSDPCRGRQMCLSSSFNTILAIL